MDILHAASMVFSITTIYLMVAVIGLFLVYDFWTHTYFRRMGIPGPSPVPVFGNMLDFKNPAYEVIDGYMKTYGPVVGIYAWRRPVLIVSDLDILRSIMIRDHHKFYNKWQFQLKSGAFDKAVFQLRDAEWKRVRDIMTPTFTGRKMKMMSDTVNGCADSMVANLLKSCDKDGTVECKGLFGGFVMDTVASCAFGLKVNSQRDKEDPFVTHAAKFFRLSFKSPAFAIVSFMPWTRHIFKFFNVTLFPKDVISFFTDVTQRAIALRESTDQSEKRVDFLQLLIDAQKGTDVTANFENDDDDIHNKYLKDSGEQEVMSRAHMQTRKRLSKDEVLAQAMLFLSAGYDTTTSTLSYASFLLATNPAQQDKLIDEIDKMAPTRDDVSYTTVSKMPYLDQVVCEVLRIYPPTALTDRECGETSTYKGFTFEKGIQIWIPPYTIHRSSQNWPDPTKFDPDRFTRENSEKRDPFTWIPFGAGPRICIGMRFALMEAKMALVRTLQKVRFEVSPLTKIPPELGKSTLLSPPNGITLKVIPR